MSRALKSEYFVYYFYKIMHKGKSLNQRISSSSKKGSISEHQLSTIDILKDSATELGMTVEYLADDAYEFKLGNATRRIKKKLIFDLDNAFTYWLCGNKYATFELLRKYGFQHIPNYKRYSLGSIGEARDDFLRRNKAVVIKPCSGTSGGQGVTVGIRSKRELNRAIFNSLMYDSSFLMEDFIQGDSFRILMFKDRMLDAFQKVPASVKGDGVNNIIHLIGIENERRLKGGGTSFLDPIQIDNDMTQTLLGQKLSLNHVPKKDEIVHVKTVSNLSAGGEVKAVKRVHDDIIDDCRRIMRIMDITLGGIDIIAKDIGRPLTETGGVVNEVNTSPGLTNHDRDVVKEVLRLMFERN